MSVSIKPLGDRILVQPLDAEQTTASGLVIPDTAKGKPQRQGPGRRTRSISTTGVKSAFRSTSALTTWLFTQNTEAPEIKYNGEVLDPQTAFSRSSSSSLLGRLTGPRTIYCETSSL